MRCDTFRGTLEQRRFYLDNCLCDTVLKAGAAFIVLDPRQPLDILKPITSQVGPERALSSRKRRQRCERLVDQVLVVTADCVARLAGSASCSSLRPDNAEYVIFTRQIVHSGKNTVYFNLRYLMSMSSSRNGIVDPLPVYHHAVWFSIWLSGRTFVLRSDSMHCVTLQAIPSEQDSESDSRSRKVI